MQEPASLSPTDPEVEGDGHEKIAWRTNAVLFAATVISVSFAGAGYVGALNEATGLLDVLRALPKGYPFALPLLTILLCHEFGHYIAARIHRVRASLPYFIPLPFLNPFGTMGAVIAMPERIRSRNALLDIGAAGPLAGLVVAVPVLAFGLSRSPVDVLTLPYAQEGQSLFYLLLKRVVLGPIPEGSDVQLGPVAFAGWTGLFVTALNLIPVGQLDGGHIAYALFGKAQDRYARWVHLGLLGVCAFNLARFVIPAALHHGDLGEAFGNSTFYLVWFLLLGFMRRRSGINHPPTDDGTLSGGRRIVAIGCLALFILTFMPTPWAHYG